MNSQLTSTSILSYNDACTVLERLGGGSFHFKNAPDQTREGETADVDTHVNIQNINKIKRKRRGRRGLTRHRKAKSHSSQLFGYKKSKSRRSKRRSRKKD